MYEKSSGERFLAYSKDLLKDSAVTGIPQIVQSQNNLVKAIKLAILVICITGFTYQVCTFLSMFFEYPTIEDVTMEYPNYLNPPAITLCDANRFNRNEFCKRDHPECCVSNTTSSWEEFCQKFPLYCVNGTRSRYVSRGIPTDADAENCFNIKEYRNLTWWYKNPNNDYYKVFPGFKNMLYMHGSRIPFYMTNGQEPYWCLIMNSFHGKSASDRPKLHSDGRYAVTQLIFPETYMNPNSIVGFHVTFHDPRRLANPFYRGIFLTAENRYKVFVSQKISESLPPPYKTSCEDYISKWKENDGHGPLTKQDCMEECKIEQMLKSRNCVPTFITYPHEHDFCNDNSEIEYTYEICAEKCKEACWSNSFFITNVEITSKSESRTCSPRSQLNCRNKLLYFEIVYNNEVQISRQKPKYDYIELFSYVGGYMAFWLGISLVSFFDFIEILLKIFIFPLAKLPEMAKQESFQRRTTIQTY